MTHPAGTVKDQAARFDTLAQSDNVNSTPTILVGKSGGELEPIALASPNDERAVAPRSYGRSADEAIPVLVGRHGRSGPTTPTNLKVDLRRSSTLPRLRAAHEPLEQSASLPLLAVGCVSERRLVSGEDGPRNVLELLRDPGVMIVI